MQEALQHTDGKEGNTGYACLTLVTSSGCMAVLGVTSLDDSGGLEASTLAINNIGIEPRLISVVTWSSSSVLGSYKENSSTVVVPEVQENGKYLALNLLSCII
jgi:hypothetical protein